MLCIEKIQRFHRFHWYIVIFTPCLYPFLLILSSNGINWLICDLRNLYSKFSVFSFIDFIPWCTCMIKFFKKYMYFYNVNLLCFTFWADSVFCNMKIKLEDPFPIHLMDLCSCSVDRVLTVCVFWNSQKALNKYVRIFCIYCHPVYIMTYFILTYT